MEETQTTKTSYYGTLFLFTEDLVSYYMKTRDAEWESPFSFQEHRHELESVFTPDIGKAVNFFSHYFEDKMSEIKTYFMDTFLSDAESFWEFMLFLANTIFVGDTPVFLDFHVFCGSVIDVADGLYQIGRPHFMKLAMCAIVYVFDSFLKDQFELNGGWENFNLFCSRFNDEAREICGCQVLQEQTSLM